MLFPNMWTRISQFRDQCENQNNFENVYFYKHGFMDSYSSLFPNSKFIKTKKQKTDCKAGWILSKI